MIKMISEMNIDCQKLSYEDLSKEFRVCLIRAFEFIPAMYNRLTLFEKILHSEAVMKIYEDHKDLPGFSRRNIYRYLPSNNPNIPHRIVPSRHKLSQPESNLIGKVSSTKLLNDLVGPKIECLRCLNLKKKNQELEEALVANSRFIQADKVQTRKQFRIPLKVNDIKHNINEREKIEDDYIWIIAYLDIESGNVVSATIENVHGSNVRTLTVEKMCALDDTGIRMMDDTTDDSDSILKT